MIKKTSDLWLSAKKAFFHPAIFRWVLLILLLIPYILYIFFIVKNDQGPIDYETFMRIGKQLTSGGEIYGENSYYPFPYVILFSFFFHLPRSISMILWLSIPVITALFISKFNPLILLFSPVGSHFLGGQTSVFGLLGLWGYRKNKQPDEFMGGVWLAIMTMKPQLAIFPLIWAGIQWGRFLKINKKIPLQIYSFIGVSLILQIPGFIISPNWLQLWLASPRPLFERALAGLVPRLLFYLISPSVLGYWVILVILSFLLISFVWYLNKKNLTFDLFMITSFIINPLIHDYDLLQLVALFKNKKVLKVGVLASLPGWITIIFFYGLDRAWLTFTIIAPVILLYLFRKEKDINTNYLG